MNFLFFAEYQSQMSTYRKATLDPRCRLDALCYFITNDNATVKSESMVSMAFSKNYEDPFRICLDTLALYDRDPREEVKAVSAEAKICFAEINDVEKVCKVLQALVKNVPDDKAGVLEAEVMREIIYNLMANSNLVRYRRYAFSILANYMQILAKRNEVQEVR